MDRVRAVVQSELPGELWAAATEPGGVLHRRPPRARLESTSRQDASLDTDADDAAVVCGRFITAERGDLRKAGARLAAHIRWRSKVCPCHFCAATRLLDGR